MARNIRWLQAAGHSETKLASPKKNARKSCQAANNHVSIIAWHGPECTWNELVFCSRRVVPISESLPWGKRSFKKRQKESTLHCHLPSSKALGKHGWATGNPQVCRGLAR